MTITFLACWLALSSPSLKTCERVDIRMDADTSTLFCELVKQQAAADWLRRTDRRDASIAGRITCERGERT